MRLHENKKLFEQFIRLTAEQKDILDIYVEKDYWVTFALYEIFRQKIGQETVFKGGTALSKCFNIIERFSEDIDLVVIRRDNDTNSLMKSKLKKVSNAVSNVIPEVEIEGITNKMGMIRKTAHNYNKLFDGKFGQVRDIIVIESSWLGRYEPYRSYKVSSYIYDVIEKSGKMEIAEEYGLMPFDVQVLDVKRTICEKIMSLVRFSFTEDAIGDLNKKLRHMYDLHQLFKDEDIRKFVCSEEFDRMLLIVANDDKLSFKTNNKWLENHPKNALAFADIDNVWEELKGTYNNDFKSMVYGELPDGVEIVKTMKEIHLRLEKIVWNIIID